MSSFALAAAGAATQYAENNQKAKAAGREGAERYRSVSEAALEDYNTNSRQLTIRNAQEDAAASQEAIALSHEADEASGSARAIAGARGVGGNTVDALLSEFSAIESENLFAGVRNRLWSRMAIEDHRLGLRSAAQQRISGAAPSRVFGQSGLSLALDIGGAGLNAAANYRTWRKA